MAEHSRSIVWQIYSILHILTIIVNCCRCGGNGEQYKIIQIAYGAVRGQRLFTLFDEKPYISFKGIPYAQPPVGVLRFKVYHTRSSVRKNVSIFKLKMSVYFAAATGTTKKLGRH